MAETMTLEGLILLLIAENTAQCIEAKIEQDPLLTLPAATYEVVQELTAMAQTDGMPQEYIDLMSSMTYDVGDALMAAALADAFAPTEPEFPRPQGAKTQDEVAAEHEGHEVAWAMYGAPGYGKTATCVTCGREIWNDGGILTEADVI